MQNLGYDGNLLEWLRVNGFPSDVITAVDETIKADIEHRCQSCGRSSCGPFYRGEDTVESLFDTPSHWVYCYRAGHPLGLCDQCFRAGKLEGFSPLEVAYFRESFVQQKASLHTETGR